MEQATHKKMGCFIWVIADGVLHDLFTRSKYRSRLTVDAMTGKLDMRAVARQSPEVSAEPEPIVEAEDCTEIQIQKEAKA